MSDSNPTIKDLKENEKPKKLRRGFSSMSKERVVAIAKKGGRVVHELGKARQWTREEAIEAAKKGAQKRKENAAKNKDVHTEHCCLKHGCKYGETDKCTVLNKSKIQSFSCETCSTNC